MRPLPFVPHAEAMFIAGISGRQLDRVVDEHLVPDDMLSLRGPTRLYARLVAPFARFYFETEPTLVAAARRAVVSELFSRVQAVQACESILALSDIPAELNWKVAIQGIEIDLLRFIALHEQLTLTRNDENWLREVEARDNLFPDIKWQYWR